MRTGLFARKSTRHRNTLSLERRATFEALEERALLSGTPPQITAVYASSTAWTSSFKAYLHNQNLGDFGFRIPTGSTQQSKPLPWINVNQISLQFSEDVNVDIADLSLTSTSYLAPTSFFYDAQTYVATWTFGSNLPKNQYHIDLDSDGMTPVTDRVGDKLDGEWTNNSSTTSGNGVEGGDFSFIFKVLPGDVNQSGLVDYSDYSNANGRLGATTSSSNYSAIADVDGSGTIASFDTQQVLSRWGTSTPTTTPIGAANDAPSTTTADIVSLSHPAANVTLSLYDYFADLETADSSLTFTIASVTNSSLMDVTSLNSGTGELTVSSAAGAEGRATVKVTATDAAGNKVSTLLTIDVNHDNQPPQLTFDVYASGYDTWVLYGEVTDADDSVVGMVVEFTGVYDGRATVREDGTFEFSILVDPEVFGAVDAYTYDWHGTPSNSVERFIGLT